MRILIFFFLVKVWNAAICQLLPHAISLNLILLILQFLDNIVLRLARSQRCCNVTEGIYGDNNVESFRWMVIWVYRKRPDRNPVNHESKNVYECRSHRVTIAEVQSNLSVPACHSVHILLRVTAWPSSYAINQLRFIIKRNLRLIKLCYLTRESRASEMTIGRDAPNFLFCSHLTVRGIAQSFSLPSTRRINDSRHISNVTSQIEKSVLFTRRTILWLQGIIIKQLRHQMRVADKSWMANFTSKRNTASGNKIF